MINDPTPVFTREKIYRRTLRNAVLVPLLLLTFTSGVLAALVNHLLSVARWDRHSVEVISKTHEIEKLLVDMETGLRGYELTGNRDTLRPYLEAEPHVDSEFSNLRRLTSDNPGQSAQIQIMQAAAFKWRAYATQLIADGKVATAVDPTLVLQGKELMDATRLEFAKFSTAEQLLLKNRTAIAASTKESVRWTGLIIAVATLSIVAFWIRQQIRNLDRSYHTALEEISIQKEWFRVTLSSIGDAVIVTNRDGKVRFINSEAERMTGWEWEDAKDKPLRSIFRIVNEETRNSVDDPVEKVFRENRVVGLANHTLLISKKGVEWPIEDSAAPILDNDNQIIGVVLVFHDATELRKANRVLQTHAEDLEKKVVERTLELHRTVLDLRAFSYTVSHDLRSPLRAMKGFSEALKEEYGDRLDETGINYLNRLANAADRLDVLIRDILAYSQVSSGTQAVHIVDLNSVVSEVIQQYPGIKEHENWILVQTPLDPVMGHEAPLTQIISNLVSNALKFISSDRTPVIRIWTEAKVSTVRLWIEDNGIGIAPSNFERIFEMFEQVNPKANPGTGIGLAIVKKAAEKMHASVGVESTINLGSKFWVELLRPKSVRDKD